MYNIGQDPNGKVKVQKQVFIILYVNRLSLLPSYNSILFLWALMSRSTSNLFSLPTVSMIVATILSLWLWISFSLISASSYRGNQHEFKFAQINKDS